MSKFLVENWKQGWKWISSWAFASILYVSYVGVPKEIIELFPQATQESINAVLAAIGFIGRFIDQQTKKKV